MLKNLFLNTSAIRYSPPDENGNKTEAELERESIQVEELQPKKKDEENGEPTSDNEEDNKGEEGNNENEEGEGEGEPEQEQEEEVEETAEEKASREAEEASKAENKTQRQIARMQKRIDQLTAKARTTEDEKSELLKLLEAKKEDGSLTLTEDEVERRAELKAQEKVAQRQFQRAVTTLAQDANKLDKEFQKNIKTVTDEIGLLPPTMIGILEDLESDHTGKKAGAEVLVYLSKNIDDYEDIHGLSEGRMALKLQQIANKITKKSTKPISKIPPPNKPVGGNAVNTQLNDKMSDEEWIRKREAETGGGFRRKA